MAEFQQHHAEHVILRWILLLPYLRYDATGAEYLLLPHVGKLRQWYVRASSQSWIQKDLLWPDYGIFAFLLLSKVFWRALVASLPSSEAP